MWMRRTGGSDDIDLKKRNPDAWQSMRNTDDRISDVRRRAGNCHDNPLLHIILCLFGMGKQCRSRSSSTSVPSDQDLHFSLVSSLGYF
jgi:hypothetical protein